MFPRNSAQRPLIRLFSLVWWVCQMFYPISSDLILMAAELKMQSQRPDFDHQSSTQHRKPTPEKRRRSREMVRLKSRYLLCEVVVQDQRKLLRLNDYVIVTAVREAVCQAHGDYGAAACHLGFTVKYLNAHTGIVLLRCRKSHYRLIWSALPFITSLENKGHKVPCFLNCLHVGGTIRTCQKFLVRYNTQQLHRMLPKCQSQEEKLEIRRAILSCSLVKEKDEAFDDEGGSGEEDEGNSQM